MSICVEIRRKGQVMSICIRSTKKALTVLKGHKKAVSYVKFLNNEVNIASTGGKEKN